MPLPIIYREKSQIPEQKNVPGQIGFLNLAGGKLYFHLHISYTRSSEPFWNLNVSSPSRWTVT